jgi:hypothetical protein
MEDDAKKHGGAQGKEKLAGLAEHAKQPYSPQRGTGRGRGAGNGALEVPAVSKFEDLAHWPHNSSSPRPAARGAAPVEQVNREVVFDKDERRKAIRMPTHRRVMAGKVDQRCRPYPRPMRVPRGVLVLVWRSAN